MEVKKASTLLLEAWKLCFMNTHRDLLIASLENFHNISVFGTDKSRLQRKVPINMGWQEKKSGAVE
jgi:hypothetical protein